MLLAVPVLRIPDAYAIPFIVGFWGLAVRPLQVSCPDPGVGHDEPPAHTPASKSPSNQGELPAPCPQYDVPRFSAAMSPVGPLPLLVSALPKSKQQPFPTCVASASMYTPCGSLFLGMPVVLLLRYP